MANHKIDFEYKEIVFGELDMDLDVHLDQTEKEDAALNEIREIYGNVDDLVITGIRADD